jgi:hypothetical protein
MTYDIKLYLGSRCIRLSSKSTPLWDRPGTKGAICRAGQMGKDSFQSGRALTPGQVASVGVPSTLWVYGWGRGYGGGRPGAPGRGW